MDLIDIIYNNPLLSALSIFMGFIFISKIFVWVVQKIVVKLTVKTKTDLDDRIIAAINHPISFLLIVIGLRLASERIDYANIIHGEFENNLFFITENLLHTFIIIILTIIVARVIVILVNHWGTKIVKKTESEVDDQILELFQKVIHVVVYIISFLYILSEWGIEVGPYLASLGIAGIVVGLALKDTLANIFGGISIILDGNIKVGDKVRLDTGHIGIIESIGIRSTKLKTFDNEMIIIANGVLANSLIHNYALPTPINRVVVTFGVAYGTDVVKVEKIVTKILESIPQAIKKDPAPRVDMLNMGQSSLDFEAKFWVHDYRAAYDAKLIATKQIYKGLTKAKIEIPFPQTDVHLKK